MTKLIDWERRSIDVVDSSWKFNQEANIEI